MQPLFVPVSGGASSLEPKLGACTAAFFPSGAGFSAIQSQSSQSAPQGRPALVVPSFVSTFKAPCSSSAISLRAIGGLSVPLGDSATLLGSTMGPVPHQPFVFGPRFLYNSSKIRGSNFSRKIRLFEPPSDHEYHLGQTRITCHVGWAFGVYAKWWVNIMDLGFHNFLAYPHLILS